MSYSLSNKWDIVVNHKLKSKSLNDSLYDVLNEFDRIREAKGLKEEIIIYLDFLIILYFNQSSQSSQSSQ